MNREKILDLATDMGIRMAGCGAEIFRVEETVERILKAYGMNAQVFAIPSYLFVSARMEDGHNISRMSKIENSTTDMDGVEHYSSLSRRICGEIPAEEEACRWLVGAEAA